MENFKGIFPGVFTVGNMIFGFLSIISSFDGEFINACWLIILAAFFDALDGKIARLSKATSRFGTELDSFADFISFGIAPSIILYSLKLAHISKWEWILGAVFVICGAYRLARFNLHATKLEEKGSFLGLPIPTAAVTLVGYILFCDYLWGEVKTSEALITMIIIFSGLMVSGIEYEGLPEFPLKNKKDKIKLILILLAMVAILLKPKLMLFPLGLFYILSGMVRQIYIFLHPPNVIRAKSDEGVTGKM